MADYFRFNPAGFSLHSTVELQKAWYLFTILLDIGRSASVEELAARCELFSVTPDFVRYLCEIPGSPICLADNSFVFISHVAISAVGQYFSKATNGWDFVRRGFGVLEPNRLSGSDVKTYFRKRRRSVLDSGAPFPAKRILASASGIGNGSCLSITRRTSHNFAEVPADYGTLTSSNSLTVALPFNDFKMGHLDVKIDEVPFSLNYADFPNFLMSHDGQMRDDIAVPASKTRIKDDVGPLSGNGHECHTHGVPKDSSIPNLRHTDRGISCNLDLSLGPPCSSTNTHSFDKILDKNNKLAYISGNSSALCLGVDMQPNVQPLEIDYGICPRYLSNILEWRLEDEENKICEMQNCSEYTRSADNHIVHLEGYAVIGGAERNVLDLRNPVTISNMDIDISRKDETEIRCFLPDQSFNKEPLVKTFGEFDGSQKCTLSPEEVLMESAVNKDVSHPLEQQNRYNNVHKLMSKLQKSKKISNENVHIKENPLDSTTSYLKLEKTSFPQFESFIIEEEEGSGGYGTVYRARRKIDGKRLAIKCPHVNAHKHNVNNELKMLDRFGGRNFIIKYEGSFSSSDSECLILEHVEHDRPEVLKKEIDIVRLQWYGYCLFKALAYLHKQGVMHRDVKPGNFLFSRKQNKGYLIDFNLAMDLQQKYSIASKSNSSHHASSDHVPVPHLVSGSAVKDRKNFRGLASLSKGETGKSKQICEHDKNLKRRVYIPLKKYPDMGGGSALRSQGADGSGITSARTLSTENRREPLPSHGRKELLSLAQNALRNADHVAQNSSDLRRKRIAAPPGKEDNKIIHPSPMLVHCSGIPVAGSSRVLKTKGDAKRKKEGSCAGTKGFRAPEVLFRSLHQGTQVDVWSAGVTLLYLMVGRSPFTGDPEQNLKDIAKLRGSEDLWEVAKLHDRESAFPGELFNISSFPAIDLQSWVRTHTKRPDFFKLIPRSLFDLVDKCLTVNPRQRITAEEALKHEFFNTCHERLRKQRILRRGSSSNSGNVLGEREAVQGQSLY